MDAIMQFLAQVVLLAILLGYFILMALPLAALAWGLYHVLHDHWTLTQTWREARHRLLHM